jgi:lactoylglutathione lyase
MAKVEQERDDVSTGGPQTVNAFRDAFPILYVDEVERAARLYTSALGFEEAYRFPPAGEGEASFVFLRLEPLGIALSSRRGDPERFNPGRDFELCIYTDDVDAAAEGLRVAGCEEVRPPRDEPWGERRTYFRDEDGHLLHVTAKL